MGMLDTECICPKNMSTIQGHRSKKTFQRNVGVCANLTSLLTLPEPSLRTLSVMEIGSLMSAITAEGRKHNNRGLGRRKSLAVVNFDGPTVVVRTKHDSLHATGLTHASVLLFLVRLYHGWLASAQHFRPAQGNGTQKTSNFSRDSSKAQAIRSLHSLTAGWSWRFLPTPGKLLFTSMS